MMRDKPPQTEPSQLRRVEAPRVRLEAQDYASGNWIVQAGREREFVARWNEFLEWTRAQAPGLRWAILIKDAEDGRHFISVAAWETPDALRTWKSLPLFTEKLAACRVLCDAFRGANYQLIATV